MAVTVASSSSGSKVMPGGHAVKVTASSAGQLKKQSAPGFGVQLLTAGTAACIADMMTFPLDTVKVRLQVQGEAGSSAVMYNGVFRTISGIFRDEGPK